MGHHDTSAMSTMIEQLKAELHAAKENEKSLMSANKKLREEASKHRQAEKLWEEQSQNRKECAGVVENLENALKETKLRLKHEQEMRQHDQKTSNAYEKLRDNLHDKQVKSITESRDKYKDRVKTLTERVNALSEQEKEHENTERELNAKIRRMEIMINELISCKLVVQTREQAQTTDEDKKEAEANNLNRNELNKDNQKLTKKSRDLKHLNTLKEKDVQLTQRETSTLKLEMKNEKEVLGNVFEFMQGVEKNMNNYTTDEEKLQNKSQSASARRDIVRIQTDLLCVMAEIEKSLTRYTELMIRVTHLYEVVSEEEQD
ncbi:hypothetical protein Q5P01_004025 [Channa striata]|uniref:Uncharacterized protein n=1 Tax=Channa striata TaxID=64152 RepID=A0AA88NMW0_CHASR|nr:hypothetical protein Q5P01_004025 [Channa striata]